MKNEIKPLIKLSIPLILAGLIEAASPFFATIFIADLGPADLAAGALVRGLFFTLMVVMWGALTAISVLVSQKHGENDTRGVSQILRDGSILALILTPPAFIILWFIAPVFSFLGQNQAVIMLAQSYLHALAWGIYPDFMALVIMQFLIGLGHTRTNIIFTLFWMPVAILSNYALIYGAWGLPKLGLAGIGWGLTFSYWSTTILFAAYLFLSKVYRPYFIMALSPSNKRYLKELLQIGLPLGTMYAFEIGFFFILTVLMGLIGIVQLAATQIVMQFLNIFVTVVFSTAQAVTIRMGHKMGEGNFTAANDTNKAGMFLCVSFMTLVSIIYLLFPNLLIGIDLNLADPKNAEIIHYTKQFLAICALFQLFEAARIALLGSLRALKDTRYTLLSSLIGFWLVPFPLGYSLAKLGLGGAGLWWGMAIGAACNAWLLYRRYLVKIKHQVKMTKVV